jgi:hypothetical protein
MAFVKMAATLGTVVSAAEAAAVFKRVTDRMSTAVVATMAAVMATTLDTAVSAALVAAMFKDMTGLVPNCSDR